MADLDKFNKYSSIENHYQEGFLQSCPQEDIEWCVTEKIHGANFQVYYDGENFLLGTRNRFLGEDNFHGLKEIVEGIKHRILNLYYDYSLSNEVMILYGEIYGDGIQKGVKYCKKHKIRFFDMKIEGKYVPYRKTAEVLDDYDIPYVPILKIITGNIIDVVNSANTKFNSLIAEGEYAELEDNMCEGVVIKPYTTELLTTRGSRVIIKKKNEEFLEKKAKPKSNPARFVDYSKDIETFKIYSNCNRFDSVFSKDNYQKENFGEFIKAYMRDIVQDAGKDGVEFLNIKNLCNMVAKDTKKEYFSRVA